jgi:hypothetical protein
MLPQTAQWALGHLLASAINHVLEGTGFPTDDEENLPPEQAEGCCRECCGTCAALGWYAEHAPEAASDAVVATMAPGTLPWSWQTRGYEIDWPQIHAAWNAFACDYVEDHEAGA